MSESTDVYRRMAEHFGFIPVFRDERGEWPERPTEGPEFGYAWGGPDPSPRVVSSGRGGMLNGVDVRVVLDEPAPQPGWWSRLMRRRL